MSSLLFLSQILFSNSHLLLFNFLNASSDEKGHDNANIITNETALNSTISAQIDGSHHEKQKLNDLELRNDDDIYADLDIDIDEDVFTKNNKNIYKDGEINVNIFSNNSAFPHVIDKIWKYSYSSDVFNMKKRIINDIMKDFIENLAVLNHDKNILESSNSVDMCDVGSYFQHKLYFIQKISNLIDLVHHLLMKLSVCQKIIDGLSNSLTPISALPLELFVPEAKSQKNFVSFFAGTEEYKKQKIFFDDDFQLCDRKIFGIPFNTFSSNYFCSSYGPSSLTSTGISYDESLNFIRSLFSLTSHLESSDEWKACKTLECVTSNPVDDGQNEKNNTSPFLVSEIASKLIENFIKVPSVEEVSLVSSSSTNQNVSNSCNALSNSLNLSMVGSNSITTNDFFRSRKIESTRPPSTHVDDFEKNTEKKTSLSTKYNYMSSLSSMSSNTNTLISSNPTYTPVTTKSTVPVEITNKVDDRYLMNDTTSPRSGINFEKFSEKCETYPVSHSCSAMNSNTGTANKSVISSGDSKAFVKNMKCVDNKNVNILQSCSDSNIVDHINYNNHQLHVDYHTDKAINDTNSNQSIVNNIDTTLTFSDRLNINNSSLSSKDIEYRFNEDSARGFQRLSFHQPQIVSSNNTYNNISPSPFPHPVRLNEIINQQNFPVQHKSIDMNNNIVLVEKPNIEVSANKTSVPLQSASASRYAHQPKSSHPPPPNFSVGQQSHMSSYMNYNNFASSHLQPPARFPPPYNTNLPSHISHSHFPSNNQPHFDMMSYMNPNQYYSNSTSDEIPNKISMGNNYPLTNSMPNSSKFVHPQYHNPNNPQYQRMVTPANIDNNYDANTPSSGGHPINDIRMPDSSGVFVENRLPDSIKFPDQNCVISNRQNSGDDLRNICGALSSIPGWVEFTEDATINHDLDVLQIVQNPVKLNDPRIRARFLRLLDGHLLIKSLFSQMGVDFCG